MSNQLQTKAATLASILAANRLTKSAEQEITHKDLVGGQKDLGAEQTAEIHDKVDGVNADTAAAKNTSSDKVDEVVGAQSLNTSAEQALASRGNPVETITPDGNATGTPAQQAKSASDYKMQLASILSAMNKRAAATNEQAIADNFRTGTEVLEKFASLTPNSTEEDLKQAADDMVKLASSNPIFQICKDRILMEKMAEDIDALAAAEGISPDEAASELQAAAEQNPEMMADLEDEASGEAVADLANAEAETDALMGGIQQMADNASNALGTEVTPEDIVSAAEETTALAEQLGVPPEALIQQALEEMQGAGAAGDPEVTPEDEANAEMILEDAAKNGVSPEEVIQMAANELGGAAAEPAAETAPVEKAASLQKRAGTMRAAFVQSLRHQ